MINLDDVFRPNKFIRQSEAGECALASLAMVARHYGDKAGLAPLRRRFPMSARGCSLKDLTIIADQIGFHTRPLKSDIRSLSQLNLPAILHWDLNHFVVLERVQHGVRRLRFAILDPAVGPRELSEEEFSDHFTGIALELTPNSTFVPSPKRTKLHLTQLWSKIRGLGPAILRILTLAVIMQVVVLVTPLYTQLAVDTALPGSDFDLLTILAIGFASLLIINAAASIVRNRLILSVSNSLSFQTATNLFRHTVFLPISWFERRHLGDISSRFGSLQPISDLLSKGLVSALVDGALAASTLIVMIIYSRGLSALVGAIILSYAIVRVISFKSMKFANANLLAAQAQETSAFIENVRGIGAIKVFCQEGNRQRLWQNKKADVMNGNVSLGRINIGFESLNTFIIGIENILFIYVSIRMVIDGEITLGMVFAFQAYKQNFVTATTRLIDQLLNYRLLDVHLDRISDIALEVREPHETILPSDPISVVELEDVSFSYGFGQPFVLRNITLRIEPGQTTALVGPSGAGKTTLFKILCGLLEPTSGRVLIDGVPLKEFGVRRYRGRLGVVSQDDMLFAGSLAENVAFFDPDYDMDYVRECCRRAAIHDDIQRMPMKYETLVGDMGSSLSGGQKQRVLLARAIFRQPDILLMDEGTAHLDILTERRVIASIKSLGGTRIMVAHRPDTIKSADKVFEIANGKVSEFTAPDVAISNILKTNSPVK